MRLLRPIAVLFLALWGAQASAFDTEARAAFVLDQTTGTVLMEKNPDTPLPPASMSKLMTLYMAFEAIADGRLSVDETLPVSQHAMSYGGSTMFLDTTDRVTVETFCAASSCFPATTPASSSPRRSAPTGRRPVLPA